MNVKKIAAAALIPAAIAGGGVALATGTAAHATATHGPARHPAKHVAAATAKRAPATAKHAAATDAKHAKAAKTNQWVTVRAGQTLAQIASQHHMSWEAIYATPPNAQHLPNPDKLTVGEHLRIPANPALRAAQFKAKYAAEFQRKAAAARHAQAQASTSASTANQPITAGMSAFEQCVAWRESSDTPTDPDGLFGMLPSTWQSLGYSGTAGQASVAVQKAAFNKLYAEQGTAPWAPYDGC